MNKQSTRLMQTQAAATAALAWPGRGKWRIPGTVKWGSWALMAAGTAVLGAGLRAQGAQLTSATTPRKQAKLLDAGAYSYSRHPIYIGLLMAASGFAVLRRRVEPLIALGVLARTLHAKVMAEEAALKHRFGRKYSRYAKRTPRMFGPV